MKYEIRRTDTFVKWMSKLKDRQAISAIERRIIRAGLGNLGDVKSVGDEVLEMRLFVSKGYRVYFTIRNGQLILLLNGGHKGSQQDDINKAKDILNNLED
ncbi:MAG: type II toxin-antitoxin system RelE/ParE family toxin [Thalassotalea sp.]|nr:type II toxin-antitoxin system RelE/ParE family toxin [Thalassotalea sp.]